MQFGKSETTHPGEQTPLPPSLKLRWTSPSRRLLMGGGGLCFAALVGVPPAGVVLFDRAQMIRRAVARRSVDVREMWPILIPVSSGIVAAE